MQCLHRKAHCVLCPWYGWQCQLDIAPAGGNQFGLFVGAGLTHCNVRKRNQMNSALGLIRPRRKNPLKKKLSETWFFASAVSEFFCGKLPHQNSKEAVKKYHSKTGFFANPLFGFFCFSRANFEISGNPDFCSFPFATSTEEQNDFQNRRSQIF